MRIRRQSVQEATDVSVNFVFAIVMIYITLQKSYMSLKPLLTPIVSFMLSSMLLSMLFMLPLPLLPFILPFLAYLKGPMYRI